MQELKQILLGMLLVLFLLVVFTVAITALNGTLYPWWLSIQRGAVESSKSFTDSNNNMLSTYITEYATLDTKVAEAGENAELTEAYKAQQKAILNKMCQEISTMKIETVNPQTRSWLSSKGGCQ